MASSVSPQQFIYRVTYIQLLRSVLRFILVSHVNLELPSTLSVTHNAELATYMQDQVNPLVCQLEHM